MTCSNRLCPPDCDGRNYYHLHVHPTAYFDELGVPRLRDRTWHPITPTALLWTHTDRVIAGRGKTLARTRWEEDRYKRQQA